MTQLCTRSLPYRSGVDYFERIRHLDAPVLLDSNKPDSPSGRYDIISANPVKKIQSSANSLTQLQQLLDSLSTSHRVMATDKTLYHLPFIGGFIGGLSYDLGRELETLPDSAKDDCHFPSIIGGIYLWAVVVDHEHQIAELVAPASEADELEALLSRTNDRDKPAPFSRQPPLPPT